MYTIKDGRFKQVKNNPEWCNNITKQCEFQCKKEEDEGKEDRCEYYRNTISTKHGFLKWNTANEKEFIDNLGSYSLYGGLMDKAWSLIQYLESQENRGEWGDINGMASIKYAKKILNEISN